MKERKKTKESEVLNEGTRKKKRKEKKQTNKDKTCKYE